MTINDELQKENREHSEPMTRDEQWEAEEKSLEAVQKKKITKSLMILAFIGVGMFGFAFANVPLFNILCTAIGIEMNPNANVVSTEATDRTADIYFRGETMGTIPIEVEPAKSRQQVNLGQQIINDYEFVNKTDRTIYFRPIHSIQPALAADKFQLSECFCFDLQKLEPRERKSLPVVYIVGSDLKEGVHTMTLNYSMYEVTKAEYDQYWSDPKRDKNRNATLKELNSEFETEAYSLQEFNENS